MTGVHDQLAFLEKVKRIAIIAMFSDDRLMEELVLKGAELDGYTVFVYSPEMIVAEKVRAICQQSPQYGPIVKRGRAGAARARDFLDIYVGCETLGVDFTQPHFHEIVKQMFSCKRVPLALIGEMESQREFHRPDFASVQATVKAGFQLKSFDEYFDYVVAKCRALEVLWIIDPPI